MPGKAQPRDFYFPEDMVGGSVVFDLAIASPSDPTCLTCAERQLLEELQRQALNYFLENQLPHGLILDRQHNHEPHSSRGLCSTSATGMGLIALALATAPEYHLVSVQEAGQRVRACLHTALERLASDHGMMPHFPDAQTLEPAGKDWISTIDSSWLIAGALWAAAYLGQADLQDLADQLYRRVDWRYWMGKSRGGSGHWLSHGKDHQGRFLPGSWNRLNAETAFLYILATGADPGQALAPASWWALESCYRSVAGRQFANADLGLFVFQYSMELLDFQEYVVPGPFDLLAETPSAIQANYQTCRAAAEQFQTYRDFWGLSAGDGPGGSGEKDVYRCYSPVQPLDGTAHLTATLASLATQPGWVLENLHALERQERRPIHGRYGLSNVNVDKNWVSRDVVGIDLGALVLALDNFFHQGRVRSYFHQLEGVRRGLERLRARRRSAVPPGASWRQAS